ncbi:hypothetical protein [Bacillus litorisediminis]|uniref:hypothetical protein n=1 Tax=Bacillus litorisediminis TaxID=2922713 RepID=UPI001FAED244|nr:hypothetical protein [Bacillus litorisediminis]
MSRKSRYISMEKRIKNIAEILEIQGNDPSTEYDQYMIGLYNGLELALSQIEQREPVFKNVPQNRNVINRFFRKLSMKLAAIGG